MRITVQVQPAAASSLGESHSSGPQSELSQLARKLGITFEPMHPATTDPQLQTFFSVEVDDAETARRIIEQLLETSAVVAAYIKPMDELS